MPRRLLGVRQPCLSWERLSGALEAAQDRPNIDEIIESQDQKLQEVKRTVFNGNAVPLRLTADPPLILSAISGPPSPAILISTHYNDNKQSALAPPTTTTTTSTTQDPMESSFFTDTSHSLADSDIDFSKPENLFLLEAPIDARKDQNMLKLAYTVPKRTFMSRLFRTYPVNRKRLAFIQRRPTALKSVEVMGNLIVSSKGGEAKEVTISCQVCGQKFSRQYQFQRHILTHPDPESKKFLCQICGKRFNRADHLNRHAILHGDIKVQKCLLCGEEFDRASHLDRHRRKHHPPAGQQPSQTPPGTPLMKSPTGMPSSPEFNGFMISPQSPGDQQLSGHNLHLLAAVATPGPDGQQQPTEGLGLENGNHAPSSHPLDQDRGGRGEQVGDGDSGVEPERPYPCEVCGRKFIRATHLRRHMRIHTGEKPFACHICGRRYARGDYLRAHIHAHRRDKIHKCKHCGEVFHDLTRFADHCRLLHKDLDDQFGNPKPPPESSPPPPSFSALLECPLGVGEEEGEEITVVPSSLSMMDIPSSIPITLVTLPEPGEQEGGASPRQQGANISAANIIPASMPGHTHSHAPMIASELPITQLHAPHSNVLIQQNGQLPIVNTATNEVSVYASHSGTRDKHVPISYVDSGTPYIYADSAGGHGNMITIYPTPQAIHQHHAHHSH